MKLDNRSRKTSKPATETDTDGLKEVSLSPWQEIVGRCIGKHEDDESISITLRVNDQALEVVIPALNQDSFPSEFIGKRIGVLRTDDLTRPFVAREIRSKKGDAAAKTCNKRASDDHFLDLLENYRA